MMQSVAAWFRALALVALCGLSGACSSVGDALADRAAEINATLDESQFRVQVGDTVSVRFPFSPELNHAARVQKDGSATFLILDRVEVAGFTVAELDARLHQLFKDKNQDKDLTVAVAAGIADTTGGEQNGQAVYVIGEVHSPGPVVWQRRRFTLHEAIGEAGGLLKSSANPRNIALVRRVANGDAVRTWFLDAHPDYWDDAPPIYLQPTDLVVVPNTAIDEANIWIDKYIRQMLPFPYLIPPSGL
jgi:protein involved in polysaccharide export with SLBB domain